MLCRILSKVWEIIYFSSERVLRKHINFVCIVSRVETKYPLLSIFIGNNAVQNITYIVFVPKQSNRWLLFEISILTYVVIHNLLIQWYFRNNRASSIPLFNSIAPGRLYFFETDPSIYYIVTATLNCLIFKWLNFEIKKKGYSQKFEKINPVNFANVWAHTNLFSANKVL